MGQTHFTRYYIATDIDGNEYAKFDMDGTEHFWPEFSDKQFISVRYVPFTQKQAFAVRQNGGLASALPLEPFVFNVPYGENITDLFARNMLKITTKYFCASCRNTFDVFDEDGVCPHCFAKNEWWCTECNAVDENPIFDKGQVLCSICKEKGATTGLQKIEIIKEFSQEVHEHFHVCVIGDKTYKIYQDHYEEA